MKLHMQLSTFLSGLMAMTMVLPSQHAWAQSQAGGKEQRLRIVVVDGEGAQNNINTGTAVEPVVEVRSMDETVLRGVEVTFQLPAVGPGGIFPGARRTLQVATNLQGQAAATGFKPNNQVGPFTIAVTARLGENVASTAISQTNATTDAVPKGSGGSKKALLWVLLAAGGGGIAAAAIAAGGGSSGVGATAVIPGISVAPGPITVGGPR